MCLAIKRLSVSLCIYLLKRITVLADELEQALRFQVDLNVVINQKRSEPQLSVRPSMYLVVIAYQHPNR